MPHILRYYFNKSFCCVYCAER